MDIELFYQELGEGFPLILLHGNGEDHTYFAKQISSFSKRFRVIAIDTRGHGFSPRGDGEFSLKRFAEDLNDFMIEKKIEKAHVLGFSDGANIAMYFALAHGEKVEKLILNGGNISPKGIKTSVQLPIEIGYRIAKISSDKSPESKLKTEILGLMVNEPHIEPSQLRQITSKTLVIAGTNDMVKRKHTELIGKSIPDCEICFIPGDHFVANKQWEKFNSVVDSFLNS